MGIISKLTNTASEIEVEKLQQEYSHFLCEDERLIKAYQLIRDRWVFTNKRLIIQNTQGATGTKKEYHSIPYRSITHFAVETAGMFDIDAEIKIWVSGNVTPFEQNFYRATHLTDVYKLLAQYTL